MFSRIIPAILLASLVPLLSACTPAEAPENPKQTSPVSSENDGDYPDSLCAKDDSCCLSSLKTIRSGKFLLKKDGESCPENFTENSLRCESSLRWCENATVSSETSYTHEEIAKHNSASDCWTAVNGTVANITPYFGRHPAGDEKLLKACGKDSSKEFSAVKKHDPKGYEKILEFKIGTLRNCLNSFS